MSESDGPGFAPQRYTAVETKFQPGIVLAFCALAGQCDSRLRIESITQVNFRPSKFPRHVSRSRLLEPRQDT